ncbi:MAG: cyclase family protein [Ruminococcaceae bacterium]|nr:cyclase family protein [Oscillospiraceae bacterium]
MKIIDISQEVLSCNVYPGDSAPEGIRVISMENGECYNLSEFSMCAHNGTHIDAPFHFINDGKTVDKISPESFVGDSYVVHHQGDFTGEDAEKTLEKAHLAGAGERILIAGDVTVTKDAAKVFAEAKIKLIGNEGQTVGPKDAPMEVHLILLGAEVVLLEGIVLKDVPEGKYFLSALPLNIAGFDGAPCRAYLIEK